MLPPPMHRCCHRHHHAAAAFPNALLLPLKPCFRQAATSAAKLAATMLLLPPPLPMRSNCCATNAYKIKKYIILLTNVIFTMMVMAARSNDCGATRQQRWQCCYLPLLRIALMLWSDKCDVNSSIKPYWKWDRNDRTHWCTKNLNTSADNRIILVQKIICIVTPS